MLKAAHTIDGMEPGSALTSLGRRSCPAAQAAAAHLFLTPSIVSLSLVGTAGFASVPPGVEQAVIDLVALRYRELDRIGMASQSVGGETTAYVIRDMPPQVATALASWKPVVPRELV